MKPGRHAFRLVQPYGKRPGEATLVSAHATAAEAFAARDRLTEQARRTGAPADAVDDLVVVDDAGQQVVPQRSCVSPPASPQ